MKKSILIFCAALTTISLMALGYVNSNHSEADRQCKSERASLVTFDVFKSTYDNVYAEDLFYDVNSRFKATISKEKLHNAKSIFDILPEKATNSILLFRNVKVTVLPGENEVGELTAGGDNEKLNDVQINLLQSTEYSRNILVTADYKSKYDKTCGIGSNSLTYYITIIPEKEAEFKSGHDKLMEYIKTYTKEKTVTISQSQLKPGRVNFMITDLGEITDITLTSTSGYDSFDESMTELVESLQGEWEPAKNSKGENVNQELTLFFGIGGC